MYKEVKYNKKDKKITDSVPNAYDVRKEAHINNGIKSSFGMAALPIGNFGLRPSTSESGLQRRTLPLHLRRSKGSNPGPGTYEARGSV